MGELQGGVMEVNERLGDLALYVDGLAVKLLVSVCVCVCVHECVQVLYVDGLAVKLLVRVCGHEFVYLCVCVHEFVFCLVGVGFVLYLVFAPV